MNTFKLFFVKLSIVFFKIPAAIISIGLLGFILLRTPEKIAGLSSFANTSNLFGSPGETTRFFDRVMGTAIILYLILCLILDIIINNASY